MNTGTVSDEIKEILGRIGWGEAWLRNRSLSFRLWVPTATGGLLFDSGNAAKKAKVDFQSFIVALTKTCRYLDDMPDQVRRRIELNFKGFGDDGKERNRASDRLQELRDVIRELADAIADAEIDLEREILSYWSSRGAPRNHAAYIIAKKMSEIYVWRLGECPTVGKDAVTGKPNGLFCTAVSDMFEHLGLDADPFRPCQKARERLKADGDQLLNEILTRRNITPHLSTSFLPLKYKIPPIF